ncbi:16S rRNA (guanine(527)-N(7))-methyltransferase RsmG [Actinoplanes sp. DH11]|uniref:16S rRNA (guanine(527)-N(7))-methyltransferase RsmG n=1 Tax=Actinoplanes sp. DH11 TaxID=2857011 RepID=UPI001E3EA21D|nr:16S rRNA (guanine(527)-N(7))-methyltransferase RsmG [Actinoplanes sp. DH11]
MTDPRSGAGDLGPGLDAPGPSSFPLTDPPASSPALSLTEPPAEFQAAAAEVFGERLALAGRYAELLGTDGVVRGLIGPREAPRLWERHLINCGVMNPLIPSGASVVDVGSGAGLPGLVLAVARPDLAITLVEPLARRTAFLDEAVEFLGLDNVTVIRGRAEEVAGHLEADIVTARAVAALDKLAGWCLPLAKVGGRLLALKGASAADEIAEHRGALAGLGGGDVTVRLCGVGLIDPPATVVDVVKERHVAAGRAVKASSRAAGAERGGRRKGSRRR